MTYGSNPMMYGIGAGNSLAYGTSGNGHYCLGGVSRNLFNESRMNNFEWIVDAAPELCILTLCSGYGCGRFYQHDIGAMVSYIFTTAIVG